MGYGCKRKDMGYKRMRNIVFSGFIVELRVYTQLEFIIERRVYTQLEFVVNPIIKPQCACAASLQQFIHLCVCVCMYVCMVHVCMYVCVCVC